MSFVDTPESSKSRFKMPAMLLSSETSPVGFSSPESSKRGIGNGPTCNRKRAARSQIVMERRRRALEVHQRRNARRRGAIRAEIDRLAACIDELVQIGDIGEIEILSGRAVEMPDIRL